MTPGESRAPREVPSAARLLRSRVVVAAPDGAFRTTLVRALSDDAFAVRGVGTTEALLEVARAARIDRCASPDLLIVDLRLVGWAGLDALEPWRTGTTAPRVILLTDFDDPATCEAAHAFGVRHVFHRPFDLDDLRCAARWLIG